MLIFGKLVLRNHFPKSVLTKSIRDDSAQSVTRFTERPQGTVVSMKKSAGLPFPAITICPNFGKYTLKVGNNSREMERIFNVTYLEKICGIR